MKKFLSVVLCLAVLCGAFMTMTPSVSAADIDYPWMFLTNAGDEFYVGDIVNLEFEMFREFNNEIYYVNIYDSNGNLVASCEKRMYSGTSSIVNYTVTWNTQDESVGIYEVVSSSEFYSLYRWNTSPNVNRSYITLKDPATRPVIGWNSNSTGWWYRNSDGSYKANEWFYDGAWYYFNASGYMVTGWQRIDGRWYYFGGGGAMHRGWLNDGGTWYYFDGSGAMHTGWFSEGGTWYYFNASGGMHRGWLNDGGTWYYFGDSGAMHRGWLNDRGTWYYFNDGAMLTDWQWLDGNWYYFYSSGAMAINCWIGNYWITSSGAMA